MKKKIYAGLVSLALSAPVYSQNVVLTDSYVLSCGNDNLHRQELLVSDKNWHVYFTKQGDFSKFRLQYLPLKVGKLELGVAAHDCGGFEEAGLAAQVKQKKNGVFGLASVRYFPSRDWVDIFAIAVKGRDSVDCLAASYADGRAWVRVGVDRKLGKKKKNSCFSVGYEIKLNKAKQWKKQYHGPRVRFNVRF